MTPLHYACEGGHIDIAVSLLQAGANVNATNEVTFEHSHNNRLE